MLRVLIKTASNNSHLHQGGGLAFMLSGSNPCLNKFPWTQIVTRHWLNPICFINLNIARGHCFVIQQIYSFLFRGQRSGWKQEWIWMNIDLSVWKHFLVFGIHVFRDNFLFFFFFFLYLNAAALESYAWKRYTVVYNRRLKPFCWTVDTITMH